METAGGTRGDDGGRTCAGCGPSVATVRRAGPVTRVLRPCGHRVDDRILWICRLVPETSKHRRVGPYVLLHRRLCDGLDGESRIRDELIQKLLFFLQGDLSGRREAGTGWTSGPWSIPRGVQVGPRFSLVRRWWLGGTARGSNCFPGLRVDQGDPVISSRGIGVAVRGDRKGGRHLSSDGSSRQREGTGGLVEFSISERFIGPAEYRARILHGYHRCISRCVI